MLYGDMAQLGARLNGIQEVRGSTPLISTTEKARKTLCFRGLFVIQYFHFTESFHYDIIYSYKHIISCNEVGKMAGMLCTSCNNLTLYKDTSNALKRKCTKCGYTTITPSANSGKGNKCPICKKFTLKNNRCESCGTKTSGGI